MKKFDLNPEMSQFHQFDLSTATLHSNDDYGTLKLLSDKAITAGDYVTCSFEYTVGRKSLRRGARIQLFTDSDSDWARPQVSDPSALDYFLVEAPGHVRIYPHIVDHRGVSIRLASGELASGEKIRLTLGDTSGGGGGTRCQTFYESVMNFYCSVDHEGNGKARVLENYVQIGIMGGALERVSMHVPADIQIGEKFKMIIKAEDAWGNPAERFLGTVEINAPGLNIDSKSIQFKKEDRGVVLIHDCEFTEAGVKYIEGTAKEDSGEWSLLSNPVDIREQMPETKLYWGDPHSGQVANPYKIDEYFEYAKNVSGMDYAGFQRNDAQHSTSAYIIQQNSEKSFYKPHEFVVLPGYEWSADWEHGGHHNVYFSRFDLPMKRWNGAERIGEAGESDLPHVRDLHNYYRSTDTIITPHVGGQHADLQYHDPDLEPALEITSTHGTFEWFLEESLTNGYEMGFLGGNDCHTGRPGDDHPGHQERRYSKGGITGTYAKELTLPGILEAIKARRVYATTGAKIRALMHVDDHFIGEKYVASTAPTINVEVNGTSPLEKIELYRGTELIHTRDMYESLKENSVRILWTGASRRWSYSGIVWKGTVTIKGGDIEKIEKIRFDSPRSHFKLISDGIIEFESWTCGYPSGFVIDFEKGSNPEISVVLDSYLISNESKFGDDVKLNQKTDSVIPRAGFLAEAKMTLADGDSTKIDISLEELSEGSVSLPMGGLNRKIEIGKTPMTSLFAGEVSYTDHDIHPGVNPYWAKITQQDMEMAWVSPVFASYYPLDV